MNKALDLNKLFGEHAKGKLLKKQPEFPMFVGKKYDGNYVEVIIEEVGKPQFITSGGLKYTHDKATIFHYAPKGVYIAERNGTDGKLGDRRNCNLTGPKKAQISSGHSYKVHDVLTLACYERGLSKLSYLNRRDLVRTCFDLEHIVEEDLIYTQEELDAKLEQEVADGYEGIVGKSPTWFWRRTTSRTVNFIKYKKRPTADLLCIQVNAGDGKYFGMIGSLLLKDSVGRTVSVGSGMSDIDRQRDPSYFLGKTVEIFYEQIMDTYVQPTFGDDYEGVLVRDDKTIEDID